MSTKRKVLLVLCGILLILVIYLLVDTIIIAVDHDYLKFNREKVVISNTAELASQDTADYYKYIEEHEKLYPSGDNIVVEAIDFVSASGLYRELDLFEEKRDTLLMGEEGSVSWEVDIIEKGFYQVYINYFPYVGNKNDENGEEYLSKSSDIERSLSLNGEIPFEGAKNIVFKRIWGNEGEVKLDIAGNDIRPSQTEQPFWTGAYVRDSVGYVVTPYMFFFDEGINTIKLEAIREPMVISSIEIRPVIQLNDYQEVKKEYDRLGYQKVDEDIRINEAEDFVYSTSPTLYAINDRSSALTSPNDPSLIKLNSIGGENWRTPGGSISWDFKVETDGLYSISFRLKQNIASGMTVSRDIYLDGEIPFAELQGYGFINDNSWRMQTLGTREEPYLFYLTKGVHTLSMEVTLGQYGPLIAQLQNSIENLNRLYREIIVFTGPQPDQYRDYALQTRIPDMLDRFKNEREDLKRIRDDLVELGSKSEKTGIIDSVLIQLDDFLNRPREIHTQLSRLNANISSLGTLTLLVSEQPIEIDYFVVHNPDKGLPRAKENQFERFFFEMRAFFATFTIDYSAIGRQHVEGTTETIEVWLSTGKDQTNILRKLIDETFSPNKGIQVDLKLVSSTALLPATLAGKGPDVSLWTDNSLPVNYAMRNAAYDLSQFEDFSDFMTENFMPSSMVPFHFNDGYYALPEQQMFLMMFYRTDIFTQFGFKVPETWTEIIEMIPTLQKHNFEFYLPVPSSAANTAALAPNPVFSSMFYQNDGQFYLNDGRESGFDEGLGPKIFETWTQFYTDYSFSVEADFATRFRNGQMPIGITYYNTYNRLSVFAPEIRGKWNFVLIPGTEAKDEDGNTYIRRETVSAGSSAMILGNTEAPEASWEFLKWWTSTDTQVRFGREMEGILGAAARYPTANVKALEQLPWTKQEYQKLKEQWDWVRGIPECPGSYMTGRHLDNAFRRVYNDFANPRETLYDYVQLINAEIKAKRREFGLD